MSKQEHDVKPDKGGDRGGRHGMGKHGSGQGDFSDGQVKKGYKKLQTVNMRESGHAPPSNKKNKPQMETATGKVS